MRWYSNGSPKENPAREGSKHPQRQRAVLLASLHDPGLRPTHHFARLELRVLWSSPSISQQKRRYYWNGRCVRTWSQSRDAQNNGPTTSRSRHFLPQAHAAVTAHAMLNWLIALSSPRRWHPKFGRVVPFHPMLLTFQIEGGTAAGRGKIDVVCSVLEKL